MNKKGKIAVSVAALVLFSNSVLPVSIKAASNDIPGISSKKLKIDKGLADISNSSNHLIDNGSMNISNGSNNLMNNGLLDMPGDQKLLPDNPNLQDANIPDLKITANGGTLVTKAGAFVMHITMTTNPLKKGTKLVLHIDPKAVQYGTLKVSNNLPVWLSGPNIDAASGTVTFTINRDVTQDGNGAIDLTGTVNEVGEYDITAQTVSPDNQASNVDIEGGHYKIIDPSDPADGLLGGYWNPDSNVDLPQGDFGFASWIGQAAGNNSVGDWLNDGNVVGMYADWNAGMVYGETAQGGFRLNINLDIAKGEKAVLDATGKKPLVKVMEMPKDKPAEDVTNEFFLNYNPKTGLLQVYNMSLMLASSRYRIYFYAVEPSSEAGKVYTTTMSAKYLKNQETSNTVTLGNEFIPRNGSSKFIPRIYGPDHVIEVKNGSNPDLKHPEDIPGNDTPVTANDVEDGDITDKITIKDDGGFDPNKEGDYEVTYSVIDEDGNEVTYKVTYHVGPSDKVAQPIVIHYRDTDGDVLKDASGKEVADETITGNLNDQIDISKYTKEDVLSYKYDLRKDLSTLPADEKTTITDQPQEYTYVYNGRLVFKSAPKTLDFGEKDITSVDMIYDLGSKDDDLVIEDDRGSKLSPTPSWILTGEVTKEFTGQKTNDVLAGILNYNNGSGDKPMSSAPIEISNHTKKDKSDVETNVSKDWSTTGSSQENKAGATETKGLKLKVKGKTAKADVYEAAIKWTLSDGVANK